MFSKSVKQTEKFGTQLASRIARKTERRRHALVLALSGELGSGKTTFVTGFARGFRIKRRITSPTFIFARRYRIPPKHIAYRKSHIVKNDKRYALRDKQLHWLWHFDCYRLKNEHELAELGFHEVLCDPHSIIIIEWAERIRRAIPKDATWITFRHQPKGRVIALKGLQNSN